MASPLVSFPDSVTAESGKGGLDRLVVAGPAGTAEVHLQGAHVTAWAPQAADPVIWMSQRSAFEPGAPLRGGVPVCFPWFGPHPEGAGPLHGFARIVPWTLTEASVEGRDVVLVLTLTDADVPTELAAAWPHPFRARLSVTVGATLTLALEVTNTGAEPMTFQEAFHTYLAVGDIREVTIRGLEASDYLDRLAGMGPSTPEGAPLFIVGETDRVYQQPGTILVEDPAGGRTLAVTATGSANAVVWNPWIAKAAAMADFGDEEWQRMLCIETCNVLDDPVTLAPGASHVMSAEVRVLPGA
jgi:D-hexose-6-phosphate mutarotase